MSKYILNTFLRKKALGLIPKLDKSSTESCDFSAPNHLPWHSMGAHKCSQSARYCHPKLQKESDYRLQVLDVLPKNRTDEK